MKKIVETELNEVKDYLDGTTLDSALVKIQEWIKTYGGDAKFNVDTDSYPYDTTEYARVRIMGMREEADHVYEERIKNEARWHQQQEERDAAEYKRLQAKFGG
jgi:hypothetical protein